MWSPFLFCAVEGLLSRPPLFRRFIQVHHPTEFFDVLRSLYIRDYALIAELSVEFDRGLNIITGETGAGKSIILSAFTLLLGERAATDSIRTGSQKAVVEAEFSLTENPLLAAYLKAGDLLHEEEQERLIIRRELSAKGAARAFVNDRPATQQVLREMGEYLVDIHGQHDHQSLLDSAKHIVYLDSLAMLSSELDDYRDRRTRWLAALRHAETLEANQRRQSEEEDLYRFQLQEISSAAVLDDEDETIRSDLRRLEHAEEIESILVEVHQSLYQSDQSVESTLAEIGEQLRCLLDLDPSLKPELAEFKTAVTILEEIRRSLHDYASHIAHDPEQLQKLRLREQELHRLKKKYGGTLGSVKERREWLERQLEQLDSFDEELDAAKSRSLELESSALSAAEKLSTIRISAGSEIESRIDDKLKDLGIDHAEFRIQFGRTDHLTVSGRDTVEFLLSANIGEEPKPLRKIASGGEISRVMLALKSVLANEGRLPLLIFDEIDVGISGRIAERVGRSMHSLAREHQILAISHLPQIAAYADRHYLVEKQEAMGSTTSTLRLLTKQEHEEAVAKLLSGKSVTSTTRAAAKALIAEAIRQ